jgi:hypothetical protein
LEMPVALCGSALHRLTQHRSRAWRDDDVSIRMALGPHSCKPVLSTSR